MYNKRWNLSSLDMSRAPALPHCSVSVCRTLTASCCPAMLVKSLRSQHSPSGARAGGPGLAQHRVAAAGSSGGPAVAIARKVPRKRISRASVSRGRQKGTPLQISLANLLWDPTLRSPAPPGVSGLPSGSSCPLFSQPRLSFFGPQRCGVEYLLRAGTGDSVAVIVRARRERRRRIHSSWRVTGPGQDWGLGFRLALLWLRSQSTFSLWLLE